MKIIVKMSQLDFTDTQILLALKKNARKAYSKIADELNISNSLVHQRINKMKDLGLVKNYDIILDEKLLGYQTKSYTGIRLKSAHFAEHVVTELNKVPEVVECNYVSGNYAIFILLFAKDNDHLRALLYDKVHMIEGVAGTDTFICFSTNFKKNVPISIQ